MSKYVKLTNSVIKYHDGLNIFDNDNDNDENKEDINNIFILKEDIGKFVEYNSIWSKFADYKTGNLTYCWDVEIPDGCKIDKTEHYYTANKLILSNQRQIFYDKELIMLCVKKNGTLIKYLPNAMKYPDIYIQALKQDGLALEYLYIQEYNNIEIAITYYREALKQNGKAIKYILDQNQTPELCMLAVEQDPFAICYIKPEKHTKRLCEIAVMQNHMTLPYVAEIYKTNELYIIALKQCWHVICDIPPKKLTEEMCMIALKQSILAFTSIPKELMTYEICKMAYETDEAQKLTHQHIIRMLGYDYIEQFKNL
jgi:hypothetical protein